MMFSKKNESKIAKKKNNPLQSSLLRLFIFYTVILLILPCVFTIVLSDSFTKQQQDLAQTDATLAFRELERIVRLGEEPTSTADGITILQNDQGEIVFSSSTVPADVVLDSPSDGSSRYESEGYTVYLQSFGEDYTAYYVAPAQTNIMLITVLILLCYIVIFIIIFFIIKRQIYEPITQIERVLHGVVKGEIDFDFGEPQKSDSSPLHSIFTDLNSLTNTIKSLMLRESNAQLTKKQAELEALQSQINPHFLYNTLESIRGQAIVYGLKDIEVMTHALSKLFRYSISNKNALVTLEEELANVDNYLLIQHIRFNNKFEKVDLVDPDTLQYRIPKLIIQPIVENAIYHGLETKLGRGHIEICAHITQKRLVINIRDDGLGIPHEKLKALNDSLSGTSEDPISSKGSSVGLRNVHKRIQLHFGQEYGMNVYSTEGVGTDIQLNMPLTK